MSRPLLMALALALWQPMSAQAQDWTPAQREVWQTVEAYWDLAVKEDLDGFLSYMHEDFLGWVMGQAVPTNKSDRRAALARSAETEQTVWYHLKPMGIVVHGNVAIAHYFYSTTVRDREGEETSSDGHWTDVLMKQGSRWVMIGDAGGEVPQD